jgi:hypothetical protein
MIHQTLRLTVCAVVLTVLAVASHSGAADPRVVEAAKKEGELVAYVSMLTENATALLAEFKKKYPFIDTSLYRATTQKLLPKIQLEARTRAMRSSDRAILEETYAFYRDYFSDIPQPTLEGIQLIFDEMAPTTPKAREAKPQDFVDLRFVKALEAARAKTSR